MSNRIRHVNSYVIRNNIVSRSSSAKFLGIDIDDKLTFRPHTGNVKKNSESHGNPEKKKYYVPPLVLWTLYFSLLYPHVTYGVPAWGKCVTTEQENMKRALNGVIKTLSTPVNENMSYYLPPYYVLRYLICILLWLCTALLINNIIILFKKIFK